MSEARTPVSVKIIKVIETKTTRGAGTDDDPVRMVTQLWAFGGWLLADDDLFEDISKDNTEES